MAKVKKKKFRKRQSVIDSKVIESGKWYQPYIHSVPNNFNKAQAQYYSGFNLKETHSKLKKIVGNLADQLINYYQSRELELGRLMYNREVSSDIIQADLNEFILEIATQYKENRATKYPFLDQISSNLYGIKNTFSKAGDAAFTEKGVNKWVSNVLKKTSFKDIRQKKETQKILTLLIKYLGDYLVNLTKEGYVNPNEQIGQMMQKILNGQSISSELEELITTNEKIKTDVKAVLAVLEAFERGAISKEKGLRLTDIAKQLAIAFGLLNEKVVADAAREAVGKGNSKVAQLTKEVLEVGSLQSSADVSDNKVILDIGGTSFDIGIDIKYHFSKRGKNMRTYRRGPNKNKKMIHIFDYISPKKEVNKMMYLLVNSYFFKDDDITTNWYNQLMSRNTPYSIYGLIAAFNGLYAAMPAKMGTDDDSSLHNFSEAIKTDTRIILAMDNYFMLMSVFLENIKEQILAGSGKGKDTIDNIDTFIKETLDNWDSNNGIKGNKQSKLYHKKIAYLITKGVKKSNTGYNILRKDITNKITGDALSHWTYDLKKGQFEINKK